jgi:hypothetical protein
MMSRRRRRPPRGGVRGFRGGNDVAPRQGARCEAVSPENLRESRMLGEDLMEPFSVDRRAGIGRPTRLTYSTLWRTW